MIYTNWALVQSICFVLSGNQSLAEPILTASIKVVINVNEIFPSLSENIDEGAHWSHGLRLYDYMIITCEIINT